jgi:CheY-like chemotaxis protein
MNSNFYYPTNTGSLGEPRRPNRFMSSIRHRTSAHFEADAGRIPAGSAKPTILVVDDDDNSLSALKNLLRPKGYRVLQAVDGRQAIEVVIAEKLDLILLDLQLPKLDGLGVIRHLRENLNLTSLRIVIMTACDSEESLGHAMACGCDEFLSKPIDFDRLEAVLDHFVPLRAES